MTGYIAKIPKGYKMMTTPYVFSNGKSLTDFGITLELASNMNKYLILYLHLHHNNTIVTYKSTITSEHHDAIVVFNEALKEGKPSKLIICYDTRSTISYDGTCNFVVHSEGNIDKISLPKSRIDMLCTSLVWLIHILYIHSNKKK